MDWLIYFVNWLILILAELIDLLPYLVYWLINWLIGCVPATDESSIDGATSPTIRPTCSACVSCAFLKQHNIKFSWMFAAKYHVYSSPCLSFRLSRAPIFEFKSNRIKSNQIKSNQIESNQIKSYQIESNHTWGILCKG